MEITDEQIKKLIKIIGEKQLIEIIPNIQIFYNGAKIYAFKGNNNSYKLHKLNDGVYAWIDLESSNCLANGRGTANEMISYAGNDIKVFNNYREFIEWNYNNLKKK